MGDQAVRGLHGKETVGRAVGNERMTAEGQAKKSKGAARQAKEKTKDVFKR
ncbi:MULTISPECIES: CsbD family protein [unclassified Streptomyces]|uniref:CsbD family protein n=1 Tax=unclassified Streptomyces TaxID=2593676 RepID=UPI003719AD5D